MILLISLSPYPMLQIGFSACEGWLINSSDPDANCDCSLFNSPTLRAGCENFYSLKWDNPTVTYEEVACPAELSDLHCGYPYPYEWEMPETCSSNDFGDPVTTTSTTTVTTTTSELLPFIRIMHVFVSCMCPCKFFGQADNSCTFFFLVMFSSCHDTASTNYHGTDKYYHGFYQ